MVERDGIMGFDARLLFALVLGVADYHFSICHYFSDFPSVFDGHRATARRRAAADIISCPRSPRKYFISLMLTPEEFPEFLEGIARHHNGLTISS